MQGAIKRNFGGITRFVAVATGIFPTTATATVAIAISIATTVDVGRDISGFLPFLP